MAAGVLQAKQRAHVRTDTSVQMMAKDICQRALLRQHVRRLCWQGDLCMDTVVRHTVEIVAGLEEETASA